MSDKILLRIRSLFSKTKNTAHTEVFLRQSPVDNAGEKDEEEIELLEEDLKEAKQKEFYSIQRIDILVITLSVAGIGFITSFMLKHPNPKLEAFYSLAIGFLVCALIFNLFSQLTAREAHSRLIDYYELRLFYERYSEGGKVYPDGDTQKSFEATLIKNKRESEFYSSFTRMLNTVSFCGLIFGILTYFLILIIPSQVFSLVLGL